MTKYWISIRKVQGDQFIDEPELGATRYLRVPDGEVPAPAHQIPMAQWTREIIASFPKVDGCPTGDLLFFVHGYNISVADVDHRHKLIQAGLAQVAGNLTGPPQAPAATSYGHRLIQGIGLSSTDTRAFGSRWMGTANCP